MAKKPAVKKPVAKTEKGAVPVVTGLPYSTSGGKKSDAVMVVASINKLHIIKDHNPRANSGDLAELIASVKKNGVIQAPTARAMRGKKGHYEIVAGERRWRAAKAAGKTELLVSVREDAHDATRALELAAAENSDEASRPLNPVERARMFVRLSKAGKSVAAIAAVTGHHDRTVRRCLLLAQAPEDMQGAVEKGGVSMMAALELAKETPEVRALALKELPEAPTVEATRKAIKVAATTLGGRDDRGRSTVKKGVDRGASLVIWRSRSEIGICLSEAAHALEHAQADDKDTDTYHNLRGCVSCSLWLRGDLDEQLVPCVPDGEDDTKAAKALIKKFDDLVKAEAAKYVPDEIA